MIEEAPVGKACQGIVQRTVFKDKTGVFQCLVLGFRSEFSLEEFVLKPHVFRNVPVRANDTFCTRGSAVGHPVRPDVANAAIPPDNPKIGYIWLLRLSGLGKNLLCMLQILRM